MFEVARIDATQIELALRDEDLCRASDALRDHDYGDEGQHESSCQW
jgi:hypothetical protein